MHSVAHLLIWIPSVSSVCLKLSKLNVVREQLQLICGEIVVFCCSCQYSVLRQLEPIEVLICEQSRMNLVPLKGKWKSGNLCTIWFINHMEESADAYCSINMNAQSLSLTYIKFFFYSSGLWLLSWNVVLRSQCFYKIVKKKKKKVHFSLILKLWKLFFIYHIYVLFFITLICSSMGHIQHCIC